MKTLKIVFLFFLLSTITTYSQYVINEDTLDAEIYVSENILVQNNDSDITLSGVFIVNKASLSISIIPQNSFAISIIPVIPNDKGEPYNKIGIDEDDDKPREKFINIHPNPTDENLTIETDAVINTVEIYTVYGEKKVSQSASSTHKEINLQFLKKGLYIVKVYLKNGVILNKMLTKQ